MKNRGTTSTMAEQKRTRYKDLLSRNKKIIITPEEMNRIKSEEWLGQKSALGQLERYLSIESPRHNIAAIGGHGTGRMKTIREALKKYTQTEAALEDLIALHNPNEPECPICIWVPAGFGKKLREALGEVTKNLKDALALVDINLHKHPEKKKAEAESRMKMDSFEKSYEERVYGSGLCLIMRMQSGRDEKRYTPEADGKNEYKTVRATAGPTINIFGFSIAKLVTATDQKQYYIFTDQLDQYKGEKLIDAETAENIYAEIMNIAEWRDAESENEHKAVESRKEDIRKSLENEAINTSFAPLDALISDEKNISPETKAILASYETGIKKMAGEYASLFSIPIAKIDPISGQSFAPTISQQDPEKKEEVMRRMQVNTLVDNGGVNTRPVIVEKDIDRGNMFGRIHRKAMRGVYTSDHMSLKAGSILRAHNGFLILDFDDIMSNFIKSYDGAATFMQLLESLSEQKLEIKNFDPYGLGPTQVQTPKIKFKVKVILLLGYYTYTGLAESETFRNAFKARVEFDVSAENTKETIEQFIAFTHKITEDEGLRPVSEDGMTELLGFSKRLCHVGGKFSLNYGTLADVIREAHYVSDSDAITGTHIEEAIAHKKKSLIAEKELEARKRLDIIIRTDGEPRIGEMTGLGVINFGGVRFGITSRATANVSPGTGSFKVSDVDTEVKLAGQIYQKAIGIISSYLKSKFGEGAEKVDAQFVMEQSYSGVDGDSASALTFCTLISELGQIPIPQCFAITGSMSMKGDMEPIGGVNEKVEGYFDICREHGYPCSHGIIIPEQNVKDLSLRKDVLKAIQEDTFHIYPVTKIEEAVEILMGIPAGEKKIQKKIGIDGPKVIEYYEDHTAYGKVQERLKSWKTKK